MLQADDTKPRQRVVLMNSGRLLNGVVYRNSGGWTIEQPGGRIQVPADEIKFVGDSLLDLYQQRRDSIVEPTPATHLTLAQWCISYRLYEEARAELQSCLKSDPDHDEARRLLKRLEESLQVAKATTKEAGLPKALRGVGIPDAESLGGLSQESAVAFTTRIQPLLMNKCGNASCHGGGGKEGFQLTHSRAGSTVHRLRSERNLAEIMKYIDKNDPQQSPLLAVIQGNHARTGPVFSGAGANEQIRQLRAWVKSVAEEQQADDAEVAARPSVTRKQTEPHRLAAAEETPLKERAASSDDQGRSRNAIPEDANSPPRKPIRDDQVRPASATESKESPSTVTDAINDPFDPDVFNRKYHNTTKRK